MKARATTVYREIEIAVEYAVSPYRPATRIDPAEGNEVEIISAKYGDVEIELTDAEIDTLLSDYLSDAAADAEDAADRRYDEARDARFERELGGA